MRILVVEPGYAPYVKNVDDFGEIDDIVGGELNICFPFIDKGVAVGYSASAMAMADAPYNRHIESEMLVSIYGTFVVCGVDKCTFASLTQEQVDEYEDQLWMAHRIIGYTRDGTPFIATCCPDIKWNAYEASPGSD